MPADFTLRIYRELLQTALDKGYRLINVRTYLKKVRSHPLKPTALRGHKGQSPPQTRGSSGAQRTVKRKRKIIVLRHDVERKHPAAVRMAAVEADLGISATYYFRCVPRFHDDPIRQVGSMGHEIGYHYEVMSLAKGDPERARKIFTNQLAGLRELGRVDTAVMHGAPLSRHHNLGFWDHGNKPSDFGLTGEPYLDVDYGEIAYLSDTGRNWTEKRFNLRDKVSSRPEGLDGIVKTRHLIGLVKSGRFPKLFLLIHPHHWDNDPVRWTVQLLTDAGANTLKTLIGMVRK